MMSGRSTTSVIPTPPGRRLRLLLPGFLPVVVWGAAVVLVVVLLDRQQQRVGLLDGVVEVREVAVAPLEDGILAGVAVDLFDEVAQDQVLALMDDTPARAELLAAEVTLRQLRSDLETARVRSRQTTEDRITERRRFLVNIEEARLSHLDRVVQQERDKVELTRVEVRLRQEEALVDLGLLDPFTRDQTRLEAEALATQLREHAKALRESGERIAGTQVRLQEYPPDTGDEQDPALLTALGESILAQERLLAQLGEKLNRLSLRAPVRGTVSRIDCRPGTTVLAGSPVLHVVDPEGTRVVAYVPEGMPPSVKPGATVSVYSAYGAGDAVAARVLNVSSRMEEIPAQLAYPALATTFGRPVLIGDLPPDAFIPGQAVLVRP
jgi:multidrug resistance efflux pump